MNKLCIGIIMFFPLALPAEEFSDQRIEAMIRSQGGLDGVLKYMAEGIVEKAPFKVSRELVLISASAYGNSITYNYKFNGVDPQRLREWRNNQKKLEKEWAITVCNGPLARALIKKGAVYNAYYIDAKNRHIISYKTNNESCSGYW